CVHRRCLEPCAGRCKADCQHGVPCPRPALHRRRVVTNRISIGTAYVEAAAFIRREKRLIAPVVLALLVLPVTLAQLVQRSDPSAAGGDSTSWFVIAGLAFLVGLIGQMAIAGLAMA